MIWKIMPRLWNTRLHEVFTVWLSRILTYSIGTVLLIIDINWEGEIRKRKWILTNKWEVLPLKTPLNWLCRRVTSSRFTCFHIGPSADTHSTFPVRSESGTIVLPESPGLVTSVMFLVLCKARLTDRCLPWEEVWSAETSESWWCGQWRLVQFPCKNFGTIRQHNVEFFLPVLLQTITYISYDKGDFQPDRDIEPTEGRFIQLPSLRCSVYLHIVCFQRAHQSMVTVREGWLAKAFFPGKTKNTLSAAAGQIMTFRSRSS